MLFFFFYPEALMIISVKDTSSVTALLDVLRSVRVRGSSGELSRVLLSVGDFDELLDTAAPALAAKAVAPFVCPATAGVADAVDVVLSPAA